MLEMRGVYKEFPGVQALGNVDFKAYPFEIHALVGENGAGKSTLMKVLAGIHPINQGEILLDAQKVRLRSPLEARAAGINLIHQELSLVPNLTVAENIFLGSERRFGWLLNQNQLNRAALVILEQLGAKFAPNTRVNQLSLGEAQLVEIARALAYRGRVLVMDEPTSALSERETEKLFEVMCSLRAEGVAIVYISHRINEVYALADRVTVLRDGQVAGTLSGESIHAQVVVNMMAGKTSQPKPHTDPHPHKAKTVLEVRELTDAKRIKPASLSLAAGEILGLSGLVGSGRSKLARLICGVDPKRGGEILIDGQLKKIESPADALKLGVAYVPENRLEQGMFLEMSVQDNLTLSVLNRYTQAGLNDQKALRDLFKTTAARLGIGTGNAQEKAGELSGGNQQKLLLARALVTKPKVIILDEATRGIDLISKAELYQLILELAAQGMAVIMISTDLPEILELCQRVLVMREGQIVGELEGEELSQENILAFATGLRRPQNDG